MEELTVVKHETIEDLIKYGYKFRIGNSIENAFKIYRKYFWGFVGFTAITVVLFAAIYIISHLSSMGSMFSFTKHTQINPYIEYLLYTPVFGFVSFILSTGYFIVARKIYLNQTFSFDNFFDGIKNWKELLFAYLIVYVVTLIFFSLPMSDLTSSFANNRLHDNIGFQNLATPLLFKSKIVAVIFIIIGIYFSVALIWVQQFIILSGMNYYKAIITSLRIISKRWFMFVALFIAIFAVIILPIITFFLFMILLKMLAFHGHFISKIVSLLVVFLPCFLWIFLTIPVFYISLYTSFEDVVGTEKPEDDSFNSLIL